MRTFFETRRLKEFENLEKEENKPVTVTWMRENCDDRVKELFSLKNDISRVKLLDDEGVDDYDQAKSLNTMPSHFGS